MEFEIALANGSRLRGLEWGTEGSATPILALHGWLDNAATFSRIGPMLGELYPVKALDLIGHGRSDHRPAGVRYHLLDNVDDVIQAADALGWQKFYLLGHSMGAGVATYVAAAFPERIAGLILIEGLGSHTTTPEQAPQTLRKAVLDMQGKVGNSMAVYDSLAQAVKIRTQAVGVISEAASALLCQRGLRRVPGGYTWSSDPRLKTASAMRLTEPLVEAFIDQLDCDTLVVEGEEGFGVMMPHLKSRIAHVKKCTHVTLPGNHHLHLEPETCAAVGLEIVQFLEKY